MPDIAQFIINNITLVALIGFLLIVGLLILIAVLLWRKSVAKTGPDIIFHMEDQVLRLERAAAHYADVSAVVAMVKQLKELDEDSVALLNSYPRSVVAAAWLARINYLGADVRAAQKQLSDANQGKGGFAHMYGTRLSDARLACRRHVEEVQALLDTAVASSKQAGGLHSV